jgi:hypothetical protein
MMYLSMVFMAVELAICAWNLGKVLMLVCKAGETIYSEWGGSDSIYSFFDVSGFKASFGRKRLTDIDKRPVRNSDIQVKNARLSCPSATRRGEQGTCGQMPWASSS